MFKSYKSKIRGVISTDKIKQDEPAQFDVECVFFNDENEKVKQKTILIVKFQFHSKINFSDILN
jgi:hypothetical protein